MKNILVFFFKLYDLYILLNIVYICYIFLEIVYINLMLVVDVGD